MHIKIEVRTGYTNNFLFKEIFDLELNELFSREKILQLVKDMVISWSNSSESDVILKEYFEKDQEDFRYIADSLIKGHHFEIEKGKTRQGVKEFCFMVYIATNKNLHHPDKDESRLTIWVNYENMIQELVKTYK